MRSLVVKILVVMAACLPFAASAQINTEQVMRVGQNALYFEDYMLSIQYFNRVIEAKPYLAKPYFFRSIAKLNLDDYLGAEADASKAIELNPFLSDAYEVRGVALQNMGRTREAILDYDRALEQLPDNRNLMFNKAMAQEDTEDYEGALKTLTDIISTHPGYENAYIGRAKVQLELGDTISASTDLDKAISINKNATNAYVLRAAIAIDRRNKEGYQNALADMNEAIRLQPHFAGFFINRAFLRYNLDDYFGAMADYDYAITLDPLNPVAYFNRGLLRAEVSDNDKAIADFSRVLEIDPNDIRSLFNRSMLYKATSNYNAALSDINRVIEALPQYSTPVYARFEIYEQMGDRKRAMADYDRALALSKEEISRYDEEQALASNLSSGDDSSKRSPKKAHNEPEELQTDPAEIFANRFSTLLTIENEIDEAQEFNNKSIRGKVQDHNVNVEIEPIFTASFYSAPTELAPTTYFMSEIDRINSTRQLRFLLQLTNNEPLLDDETLFSNHFNSIEYYNSYLSTHTPRAIDYFARAMDFFTLRNYESAVADFTRAIETAPDFTLAYFMRAAANQRNLPLTAATNPEGLTREARQSIVRSIIDDYNRASELAPSSPFPYFNKGNVYLELQDLTSALSAYSKAIEMKPDFGEAYYNRGYVYFKLGNREAGTADLSRAGQLGIVPSYNLLKRMNR